MRTQAQMKKDFEVYTIYKLRRNKYTGEVVGLGAIVAIGSKDEIQTYYGIDKWNYKNHGIKTNKAFDTNEEGKIERIKKAIHTTYTSCVIKDSYTQ